MELDQILFKKIIGFYDKWKSSNGKEETARAVKLEAISPRLTLLARALTGRNVDILPAEKEGGWKDDAFYLPISFSKLPSLEQNLYFYLYRVVYLSIQSREQLNWNNKMEAQSLEIAAKAAAAAPIILGFMQEESPPWLGFLRSKTPF
ncbi:MAG: hypothetical protein IPL27_17610 [Lewinellaceae bacterium]|nr:hypothetical protein [Lewinellaceae bacterium]